MVTDLFDAKTNLDVGAWYLQRALERWRDRDDPVPFALAEYNAGRSNVDRWITASGRGAEATAADLFNAIDFPSTKKYLAEITLRYRYYRENESG